MPLVRIDLRQGKTLEYRRKIGDAVYHAMAETIDVPEHDRFQVIADHPAEGLIYDPTYLGINRTDDILAISARSFSFSATSSSIRFSNGARTFRICSSVNRRVMCC
jgi:hypothetical protein